MRIKHTYCLIATFILSWIFLYFTFLNQPVNISNKNNDAVIDSRLQKLGEETDNEFKLNKNMLNNLHRYLENKQSFIEKVDTAFKTEVTSKALDPNKDFQRVIIPVLVIACDRVSVARCLDQLIQYRPDPDQFPIIVSQDCNHAKTTEVINRYVPQVSLIKPPNLSKIDVRKIKRYLWGYFKIARHYGWALNEIFFNLNFKSVIIVEDDLDIALDFFEYFLGTYPLLHKDPSIWCISAWNDNGKMSLINEKRPELLYRTDFFPGLGWLMLKALWMELSPKWPTAYWDDWIRLPQQRKERACLRPEISRTRTFGKHGVSNGLFFEKHLKFVKLNENFVHFTQMNLSYLMKDAYDTKFVKNVYQNAVVTYQQLKYDKIAYDGPVRIIYHTSRGFKSTAKLLGLMDDFRSGVPRTSYRGIITFTYKGRTVYLTPIMDWKGYNLTWN